MSDDRPRSEDGHEPHGVVETLREEIEEAVEHVPEPVRWTVGKLARLVSLVLIGLLVLGLVSAILFFMNRTELVARELSLLLNRTLREHSDLVLDLRDIRGNPFTGFRAIDPRIRFRDGSTLLAATEMRVEYSAWGIVTGRAGSIDVTIERPHVRLVGANGSWRLPVWRSDPSRGAGSRPRELQLNLRVRDATVASPAPYGQATRVDVDVIANLGPATRVRLKNLSWATGPWQSALLNVTADLTADPGGVEIRVTELRTPDLELRAEAHWRSGEAVRHVHLAVGRARWGWLARVFDNRSFDVPGDGAFVIDAEGAKDWQGRFSGTLDWDGLAIEGRGTGRWKGQELRLDSLVAQTGAGDLTGGLRWSRAGWEIAGDARHADPAEWHALHLDGWPKGDLNGWFRYALDTRARPSGMLEAKLIPSEWQRWHADEALVHMDFPAGAPDSFRVVGTRRGGQFALHGRSEREGGDWSGPYSIRNLPLEEWPDGHATGLTGMLTRADGTISSRAGGLAVTGELSGTSLHWAAANFSTWMLRGVRGRLLPTPDLTAEARGNDGTFLGIHVDRVEAPLVLGDHVVRFAPLTAQAGDTTLAATGQAAWDAASWWMTLPSAEMTSRQFHFRAEPPVRLSGDANGVTFEHLAADDRDGHFEAHGRWAAPGGSYDFECDARALNLARLGFPEELGLSGQAALHMTVQGRSGEPGWRFEGRARAPGFGGHVADSLWLVLSGGAHRLELEDGRFQIGGGTLRAAGAMERAPAAFPDSLSVTALVRWLRNAGGWRGHATSEAFPVAPLAAVMPAAREWDGRVSGTLAVSGTPARPVLDIDARADRFGWRDIRAERADLRARYAEGRLDVKDVRARMQNVESTANLSVPLRLALGDPVTVPDEAIRGRIDVPSGDLQLLPLIVPQLQSARGRFELAAEIGGTARSPKLSGSGHIRDGVVRPVNRSEVVEGLGADLHFDQSRVTLDTLWASQGRTGRLWSKGAVLLDRGALRSYRFDLAMRDFAANEEGIYAMLFDGDFVVSDGPRVGGERLPQVTGQARIKKGLIEFDFANQSEVQKRAATTQPLYWTYRIKAEATSNLRWRPQGADMEFDAGLDLQQTADSLLIFGEMHALRGTYWFLSNRFRILNADLVFDNQQGVDPILDIAAETRVRGHAQTGQRAHAVQEEKITAKLTGRASKPVISLTSGSGWEQREILGQLTVGTFQDANGNISPISATDPLDNYFTRQLNAQLSAGLSEFFQGAITDWELQRDQGGLIGGQGAIVIGVGSQVTDRLALRYQQRVQSFGYRPPTSQVDPTSLFEQNVEAEYRLNRFIYVTSGVSRRRSLSNSPQPNTDYNLNLKARWEY